MMHVLDKDFNIVINPCTLTKIPGGFMDHIKLAAQILSIVNSIQTYENVSSFEPAEKSIHQSISIPILRLIYIISTSYFLKLQAVICWFWF